MYDKDIAIIIPTNGKPHGTKRTMFSYMACADRPDRITFYLGLDCGDPNEDAYKGVASQISYHAKCIINITEYERTSVTVNKTTAMAKEDILHYASDDLVMETMHWDTTLRNRLPDNGIFNAWFSDGQGVECLHPVISRKWIDAIGYYAHENLKHYYIDSFVNEVGRLAGVNKAIPEVVARHLHTWNGKGEMSKSVSRNKSHYSDDSAAFARLGGIISECAKKIRAIQ